jgi:SAM-dependent methyltransferase
MPAPPSCRLCGATLARVFCDLGKSPLANSYLSEEDLGAMEPFYPLRARVCDECLLVQLEQFETPEAIFSDYAYMSSYSTSWLEHSRALAEAVVDRFGLGPEDLVVELASNDGYLLRYFAERDVRVLGVEPAANVAAIAQERGIPTRVEFFGERGARALRAQAAADVVLGLNVLAHVPDLNDFVAGIAVLLAADGVAVLEFPHLLRLIEELQFDTIYHEHFSYFSLLTARRALDRQGLEVFDVEELPSHGGSLRLFVQHGATGRHERSARVGDLARREEAAGLDSVDGHADFGPRVEEEKLAILSFLIGLREQGLRVVGYGAPAKGNTMLNFCGIGRELIDYTVDLNPHKQGRYLPGSEIPIRTPDALMETRPDVVLILPWNIAGEIVEQLAYVREWNGRFAARTPTMALLP